MFQCLVVCKPLSGVIARTNQVGQGTVEVLAFVIMKREFFGVFFDAVFGIRFDAFGDFVVQIFASPDEQT